MFRPQSSHLQPIKQREIKTTSQLHFFIFRMKSQSLGANIYIYIYIYIYSTRSPLLTCMSRRAQSGRRSSFGKRVWFTESHIVLITSFLLVVLFTRFIVDNMKEKACCIKLNNCVNHILLK